MFQSQMDRVVLRTTKNVVTGLLCCKLCCCVRIYKIKLLIWVIKCCLCKGHAYKGLCPPPQAKKPKIIFPPNLRGYTINALTSGKLRKSDVDPLGFCPGSPTLQHQPKLPSLSFSTLWKSRGAGEQMPLCQLALTAPWGTWRKLSLAAPCHKQSVSNCSLQKS